MSVTKLLIANRGEIAIRIARAAADMGLPTVAVYSEDDGRSLHLRAADECRALPGQGAGSYLNVEAVIAAATASGCDAIHPGYGFLAESSYLAEICEACNIKFIGPGPQAIRLMGDKSRAKKAMIKAGVPVSSVSVASRKPTTAGMPNDRAMIAVCEVRLPRSSAIPRTCSRFIVAVSDGVRLWATRMCGSVTA